MRKKNVTKCRDNFHKPPMIGVMIGALLLGLGTMIASAQSVPKANVRIAFAHQPGPVEQALVRGFGGEIKYTYHLVPAIAASMPC